MGSGRHGPAQSPLGGEQEGQGALTSCSKQPGVQESPETSRRDPQLCCVCSRLLTPCKGPHWAETCSCSSPLLTFRDPPASFPAQAGDRALTSMRQGGCDFGNKMETETPVPQPSCSEGHLLPCVGILAPWRQQPCRLVLETQNTKKNF